MKHVAEEDYNHIDAVVLFLLQTDDVLALYTHKLSFTALLYVVNELSLMATIVTTICIAFFNKACYLMSPSFA